MDPIVSKDCLRFLNIDTAELNVKVVLSKDKQI